MTIYRRRRDFGILENQRIEVSGEHLTGIIEQLRHDNPYCGETMMMGSDGCCCDGAVSDQKSRSP